MSDSSISWQSIEAAMNTFRPTTGGFSIAKRGIVKLQSGRTVFVKLATDDDTRKFIAKEIIAYTWLTEKGYPHIPKVLLTKEDGLVLPNLSRLDWSDNWNTYKLQAVLRAIDDLSKLPLTESEKAQLPETAILNGWQALVNEPKYYKKLLEKLEFHPEFQKFIADNLESLAEQADAYLHDNQEFKLIHADIRADNLAYNDQTHEVSIIDWNWMGMGRKGIEDVALLVNVAHSGFEVEKYCPERLDYKAARVLAGFWFYHSTRRIWEGGNPALRDFQFKNALQASKWARLI